MTTRLAAYALAFWTFWTLLPAPRWNVSRLIAYFCMQGGGAYIVGSANFDDCNFYGNEAAYGGGAYISGSANFNGCDIFNNVNIVVGGCELVNGDWTCARGSGGGVAVVGSADFVNCNIFNNEAENVRARILNLLEPSSSAPLNSDTFALFDTQCVGARISNFLEPSSSAPLERFTTDCILLHAGRRGLHPPRICYLHWLQFVR